MRKDLFDSKISKIFNFIPALALNLLKGIFTSARRNHLSPASFALRRGPRVKRIGTWGKRNPSTCSGRAQREMNAVFTAEPVEASGRAQGEISCNKRSVNFLISYKIIKSFTILMVFVANNSFGYFYYLCIKKGINKNGVPQKIVLLADYHDKTHSANKGQRAYFELLLTKCKRHEIKLVVEDLSSINNDGRMICCKFGINCADGVLSNLAHKARSLGIAVDNVEYRYCRVAGIGPLITNLQADPYSVRSSCSITLLSLYKEIVNEMEKIKKYNDGKTLNDYYKRSIAYVCSQLNKMKIEHVNDNKTVAHYCSQLRSNMYRKKLEHLCIFDSAFIDSNVMHSIMCCDVPIIFVAAGGSHITQVNRLLEKMGYESIFVVPDNYQNPIDITVLDRFIQ